MSEVKETLFGTIPKEWDIITAEKYCIKVADGTHDSPKEVLIGFPLVTSKHIKGNEIDFSTTYNISEDDYNNINKRSNVDQWDVIISMIGEYCGFSYIEENEVTNYAVKNVGLFKLKNEINSKWLYYFLQSKRTNFILNTFRTGTSQPYLTLGTLRNFPIVIPADQGEKKQIVQILDSFRNKINLLQAQNKTLEETAQTIFKEWFGKYQIGDELPEGWREGKLSEIAEFLNGLALQKYPAISGQDSLPVIKIRELKQGITSNTDRANKELDSKYIVENGDVLFSWSGSLEVVIWQYGQGALNQHLFKVTSNKYPKWFYYYWTLEHLSEFRGIASDKATTMGHINRNHLDMAKVLIPDKSDFEKLNGLFVPILGKLETNNTQIQSLTQTRDELLPKLMSGEIRVNEFNR